MKRLAVLSLLTLLLGCTSKAPRAELPPARHAAQAKGAVVGIFSDVHSEYAEEEKVLRQMRERGVTDLIGNGDFILYGELDALTRALTPLTPLSGVSREHIFLAPGNWEQTQIDSPVVDQELQRYGNLIVGDYDRAGYIDVGGAKLRVGHFPQHALPKRFLPPAGMIKSIEGQITLVETLPRNDYPDRPVDLEIVSHTHIGGIYFDRPHQLWVLNPGDLEPKRKVPGEPQAFAIYYPSEARVIFINADTQDVIREVHLNDPNEPCRAEPCNLR